MSTAPEEAAQIAKGLDARQVRFLRDVCEGRRPVLASREEDRARQKMRRAGLVHTVMNPRRWEALPLGLAVRDYMKETSK